MSCYGCQPLFLAAVEIAFKEKFVHLTQTHGRLSGMEFLDSQVFKKSVLLQGNPVSDLFEGAEKNDVIG